MKLIDRLIDRIADRVVEKMQPRLNLREGKLDLGVLMANTTYLAQLAERGPDPLP